MNALQVIDVAEEDRKRWVGLTSAFEDHRAKWELEKQLLEAQKKELEVIRDCDWLSHAFHVMTLGRHKAGRTRPRPHHRATHVMVVMLPLQEQDNKGCGPTLHVFGCLNSWFHGCLCASQKEAHGLTLETLEAGNDNIM